MERFVISKTVFSRRVRESLVFSNHATSLTTKYVHDLGAVAFSSRFGVSGICSAQYTQSAVYVVHGIFSSQSMKRTLFATTVCSARNTEN